MDFSNVYLLDDLISREQWRTALLLLAMAGVALLFLRNGAARVVGVALIVLRLVAMPMTGSEWLLLGSIALVGAVAIAARRREERSVEERQPSRRRERDSREADEPDDVGEPAPCPACHAVIPAGWSRCPSCGWTYTTKVS
jgi:hypothetical protein